MNADAQVNIGWFIIKIFTTIINGLQIKSFIDKKNNEIIRTPSIDTKHPDIYDA